MGVIIPDGVLHRINDRIAGDINPGWILPLFDEVLSCHLCRRKVILRNDAHCLTVKLLGIR